MNLENKTNSIWREMGVLACAGIMAFTACTKHENNRPQHAHRHAQTQKYVLQPVNFDVLDQNGVYESYRDVTGKQADHMCVEIPKKGSIELLSKSNYPECVVDMMISKYVRGELQRIINPETNSYVFKKIIDAYELDLKAGTKINIYFLLEPKKPNSGLPRQIESMKIPGIIIGAEPEPQPESRPESRRPKRSLPREYEPEEQPQVPPVIVYYPEQPRVVRFVGGPRFIFQSGAGYVPYGVGGYAHYPMMVPGPRIGVGYAPPRSYMNNCPPPRQNMPVRRSISRSSLAPSAHRAGPVTRSNLSRNAHPAPVRRR